MSGRSPARTLNTAEPREAGRLPGFFASEAVEITLQAGLVLGVDPDELQRNLVAPALDRTGLLGATQHAGVDLDRHRLPQIGPHEHEGHLQYGPVPEEAVG